MVRSGARLHLVGDAALPLLATPVSPLHDSELVASIRAGDPAAVTAFHDRLRPRVELTIRRLLGRRDNDHEDVVQLSMIELIHSIERYRGECSLESWASTVAAHVVYKHLRRRQLERRVFDYSATEYEPASPIDPDRAIVARDLERHVRKHLAAIDANKAWTFLLHDVCGFDLREVAAITNVSVAAAQQRLVRGRRDVHERIAADPELANFLSEMETES